MDTDKMFRDSERSLKFRLSDLKEAVESLENALNDPEFPDVGRELREVAVHNQRVLDELAIYNRFRNEAAKAIRELQGEMAAI